MRAGARIRISLCLLLVLCSTVFAASTAAVAAPPPITTERAATHPMRYHLCLPVGWNARREWPVLVVIPDAKRDFEANLALYARARGQRPYILVAPEVLSCGGQRTRMLDLYAYTPSEWDALQGGDDFAFEDAGLAAILADVHARWHGESQAFLTGWEAGGHTVWAQALRHPERWRGVVPVTPNYQRRGVDAASVSRAPVRATLPIQPLRCGAPTADEAPLMPFVEQQTAQALADARGWGFRPRPLQVVARTHHTPLEEAVLAWCDSLRGRR